MEEHRGLLDIHHLSARYPCGTAVLHDVSLHMHSGEIVCVIGESGCGKSTLLRAILRMPGKVDITKGQILYRGTDLCTLSSSRLRQIRGAGIGMIFQEPGASLDPIRRIGTQFYETLRAHGHITRAQAEQTACALLLRLELSDPQRILKSCPVQLSGGMNQRVAIALAMALHPDVLLADEPTSALDVLVQAQIVNELLRLRNEFGTGILLVTHNMGVVAKMADKVAVMYGGRIVEYGYRDSILTTPSHPYTKALMEAIPRLDGTPPRGLPGRACRKFPQEGCAFAPRCPHAQPDCLSRTMGPIPIYGEHWTLCRLGGAPR
ncbi:MAG: ABC transporter ATP-binding protein [Intestinimonas sp.]|jgi:oligopeptide/dipeptide ABC transporter ATP-binding protein|nr:ABC transporter ATP-binding protein [Intestinimonas sp.]